MDGSIDTSFTDSESNILNWFLIDSWWHAYNNHGDNEPYSLYFEDIPKQVGLIFPETLKTFQKKLGIEFGAHWSSSFSSKTP